MTGFSSLDELELYQEALSSAQKVFTICTRLQVKKEFELQNQLKRAAVSVFSNIAEGYGRKTQRDFAQFISIAMGSANELTAQLEFVSRVFSDVEKEAKQLKEQYLILGKRLYCLRKHLTKNEQLITYSHL